MCFEGTMAVKSIFWANFSFEGRKYNFGPCVFLFLQMTGSFFGKIFYKCGMIKERVEKVQDVEKRYCTLLLL